MQAPKPRPFTLPPHHTWIDHSNVIHTDRDTLYALLSDIDRWPDWTPGLRSITRLGGKKGFAGPGAKFVMTLDAPLVKRLWLPAVMRHNTPDRIEWGGGAAGSFIDHFMELTPLGPHCTRLRHVERASGLLAVLAWPAAGFAHRHDLRWSRTIEARFPQGQHDALRRDAA